MSETRATIRTRIERHVGTAISTTINDAIKEAFKEIQRAHNWPEMEASTSVTVSSGDSTFTLPDDFKQEMNPEMSDTSTGYRRMTKVIKNGIEARDTDDEGRPLMYRIWEGVGKLYGKADQDYTFTMEYYKWLTDLTADDALTGDESTFLDRVYRCVEAWAIAAGKRRQKKFDEADYWQSDNPMRPGVYENRLKSLINDDLDIQLANQDLAMEMPG